MSIDSHQSEVSNTDDSSYHAGVHVSPTCDHTTPSPGEGATAVTTSGFTSVFPLIPQSTSGHDAVIASRPTDDAGVAGAATGTHSSLASSTGSRTPSTSGSLSDDERDDDDDLHSSKTSLSLEFDDYPLDLVSPITKVNGLDPNAETDLDLDAIKPAAPEAALWCPQTLLRRDFSALNNNKRSTSTPKNNGDRLSFMEYNEILYDAGTEDQKDPPGGGFIAKRTSTPKYPLSKHDRLSGYVYDALNEYPRRSLFRDAPGTRDPHYGERSRLGRGDKKPPSPAHCLRTLCGALWRPFLRSQNPMPSVTGGPEVASSEKPTRCARIHRALLCPPKGRFAEVRPDSYSSFSAVGVT